MNSISENLDAVRNEIAGALETAGLPPETCTLVAVSKTHGKETVQQALAAGQRVYGENRVQEAAEKWPPLKAQYPDTILHLIGQLQTNKVREALDLFDVIETLDRPKLARRLATIMAETGAAPKLFIQVNTGEELQKGGVLPKDLPAFVALCRDDLGLTIAGLMCIPPADDNPAPHFALLRKLAHRHDIAELSMGMSGDYKVAAALGATQVRVGTGVFGPRQSVRPTSQ